MELLLIAVIVVAAAPYVLGPVLIHARNRQNPRPTLVSFDAAKHALPAPLTNAAQGNVAALTRAGLRTVADLFRPDGSTLMRVILMDTAAGDLGLVIAVSPKAKPDRGVCGVEFVARFEGDRSLTVANTPIPGTFGPVPGKEKVRMRAVRDPARLLRIFQAIVARRVATMPRESPDYRTDPAGFLAASMARELRQQVDTGYLRLDPNADVYRPTWKGAWLMTWKLLQPIRAIREWWSDRRASALLRELRLEKRDTSPVVAPAPRALSHWNWLTIVASALVLVVRPSWLDPGRFGTGRPTPERLPPGFVVPADFAGAVTALETLAGATATPLVVQDSLGQSVTTDGIVVPVTSRRAEGLVAAAQGQFLAQGFYLFRVTQHFGLGDRPDTLALYPSRNAYAILRLVGTNGANYDIGSDSIVAWLSALERDQPFVLTGIGFDWLEGRFTTPLADPDGLARRFNAFCPDIVTQGTRTVAALSQELRRSAQLYCWWD